MGSAGLPGIMGTRGSDGQSVIGTPEPAGANCPAGGVKYTSATRVDYVCNGVEGPKGAAGTVGPQGPVGSSGPAGAQGPAGPMGAQGPAGPSGAQGPAGPTGEQGPAGQTGPQGPAGPARTGGNADTVGGLDASKFMRTDGNTATVGRLSVDNGLFGSNGAGNFHIDSDSAKSDGRVYVDWFSGRGVVIGNGAQDWTAIFGTSGDLLVRNTTVVGSAGACCAPAYTLALGEQTTTNGRLASLELHDGGLAEAQLVLTAGDRNPGGVGAPGSYPRRTLVLQSTQDALDLYVTGNIMAGGTKSFVHPHPHDPKRQIVYVALEGGEAGTYARGSAELTRGRARLALPEHFALITAADGITAQVTARDDCALWVERVTPSELVVRARSAGRCRFDWLAQGVRRGYERFEPIARR
jgi:hypothetical protein